MAKSLTNRYLINLVIFAAVLLWVVDSGILIYRIVEQLPSNPNLSGFYSWALTGMVSPLIIAAIFYMSRRERKLTRQSVFEVISATIAVTFLAGGFSQLQMLLSIWTADVTGKMDMRLLYLFGPVVFSIVITIGIAWYLRRTKSW